MFLKDIKNVLTFNKKTAQFNKLLKEQEYEF